MAGDSSEDDRLAAVEAREAEGWPVHGLRSELEARPHEADLLLRNFDARCRRLMRLNDRIAAVDETLVRRAPPPSPFPRQDVTRVEELEAHWADWSARHRPHGVLAEAAEDAWRAADRSEEFLELVRRLDRLDPALAVEVHVTQRLLLDPGHRVELRAGIERAEAEQSRQQRALSTAAERLRDQGIPIPSLDGLSLMEGYDLVDQWTRHGDALHALRLRIDRDVRPFDSSIAESLREAVSAAAESTEEAAIVRIADDIVRRLSGFQRRLDELNETLDRWREEGYRLPMSERVGPEELLDWEANMADIERMKDRHGLAWRRLKELEGIFGDEAAPALSLAGDLTATEAFIDHVDALHASWGQASAHALNILESWDIEGMETAAWHEMVQHDPVQALGQIEARIPMVHRAIELRRRLHALDLSLEGEQVRTGLDRQLRSEDVDEDSATAAERWIARMERRNERHLRLILEEWSALRREGWTQETSPPQGMSLRAAEDAVNALRRGTRGRKDRVGSNGRILARLEEELLEWASHGWDVDDLIDAARAQPLDIGLRISNLRSAVLGHRRLVRRLESLPWERDVALGQEVRRRMRRPQDLEQLTSDIPSLARHLATLPPDSSAPTWRAWTPNKPTAPKRVPSSLHAIITPSDASLGSRPMDMDEDVLPEAETEHAPLHVEESEVDAEHGLPNEDLEQQSEPPGEVTVSDANNPLNHEAGTFEQRDGSAPHATHDEATGRGPSDDDMGSIVEHEAPLSPLRHSTLSLSAGAGDVDLRPVVADLLSNLGLHMPEPADAGAVRRLLAPHANTAPRDLRVGRLLRLTLRLLPDDLEAGHAEQFTMLERIATMAEDLGTWTTLRLRGRNLPNGRGLLKDAATLGSALERIPGPGHPMPLKADDAALPAPSDLDALEQEVDRLSRAVRLPAAGGVR